MQRWRSSTTGFLAPSHWGAISLGKFGMADMTTAVRGRTDGLGAKPGATVTPPSPKDRVARRAQNVALSRSYL